MKKIMTLITIVALSMMVLTGVASAQENSSKLPSTVTLAEGLNDCDTYTFANFKEMLKKDINKDDLVKAEELFNKATKLDEKAISKWNELYSWDEIYNDDYEIEPYTFEDFKEMLKEDISKADFKEVEKLFNEAMKLEEEEKYEEAQKVWDKTYSKDIFNFNNEPVEAIECEIKPYTFEDFKVMLKKDISETELKEVEKLFDEAMKLEEEEKYEEAEKVWEKLYNKDIFDYEIKEVEAIECEIEPYTFEDFKEMLKEDISKADLKEVEKLFNEATKLEEEEKYEEAQKVWEKLYSKDIFDFETEAVEAIEWEIEPYTFEDFKEMLKEDISKADFKDIKKLFNEATKLEEEQKYEEAQKVWDKIYSKDIFDFEIGAVEAIECEKEPYTFEDFKEMLKKDISEADLKEIEKLFNEAMKHEEEEKYEEAQKVWDKIYSKDIFDFEIGAVEAIECEIEPYTFEDFKEMLKKDISEADLAKAEKLFNEAIEVEKEAQKVWDELYSMDIFEYYWNY